MALERRISSSTTAEEFIQWTLTFQGPPPGMFVGGTALMSENTANNVLVDVTPGTYAMICFVPDASDGQPHFTHGMVKELTVAN